MRDEAIREFPDTLHVRGGVGAGDMVNHLATAFAWSARYGVRVDMNFHWEESEDWLYHRQDKETVCERLQNMHDVMAENHRVDINHEWESDMFSFANSMMHDQQARVKYKPPRFFLESKEICEDNMPLANHWYADWQWVDKPHRRDKTIVLWTPQANKEEIKDYKQVLDWDPVLLTLDRMFPDHVVVPLNYRDSFAKAYHAIQGCDFCVGYDGMWHYVARLFGKHFVAPTGDPVLSLFMTNPSEAICSLPHQFWLHLDKMRDEEYRELMIEYSAATWRKRLNNITNPRHGGYVRMMAAYDDLLASNPKLKRHYLS